MRLRKFQFIPADRLSWILFVSQELHPALFVLMKSTEPWYDEYFMLDLKAELEKNGFTNVTSTLTSPRHATVTATAA
jgi:hypothetical protein